MSVGGSYGKVFHVIWKDPDFVGLEERPQRLFLMLLSYPSRNYAGVLPLTLARWARTSVSSTVKTIKEDLAILEQANLILIDWETDEVMVRSYIRWDELYLQPQFLRSLAEDIASTESEPLREALHGQLVRLLTLDLKSSTRNWVENTLKTLFTRLRPASPETAARLAADYEQALVIGTNVSSYGNNLELDLEQEPGTGTGTNPPAGDSKGASTEIAQVEDEKPTPQKRATRLSEDWQPTRDVIERMKERYPTLDLRAEFEKFQNHHIGRGSKWVDWNRCWWKWVQTAAERQGVARGRSPAAAVRPGADEKAMEWQQMKEARKRAGS